MNEPTCVIAEDEPVLRAELRETLAQLWPQLRVVVEAGDGVEAMRAIEAHAPRILFLDIEMPGMNGLEVAAQASRRCHVVFVTAYDRYALAAFEQGALDYVLKPFTPARLAGTVNRLKERLNTAPADLEALLTALAQRDAGRKPYLRWIKASQGQNTRLITVAEVFYFQSDNKYTLVVTREGEAVIRTPLNELLAELDPQEFWQIHRGIVVNVSRIASVHRRSNGTMDLRLKDHAKTLPVSTTYAHLFRQM